MKQKTRNSIIIGAVLILIAVIVFLVLPKVTCLLNSCHKFRQSGSEYCLHHSCTLEDCNEQKSAEDPYCYIHNCSYDGCSKLAVEFDGMLNYCEEHQCTVDGCTQGVEVNGHCLPHICCDPNCSEPTNEYHSYCAKHSRTQ